MSKNPAAESAGMRALPLVLTVPETKRVAGGNFDARAHFTKLGDVASPKLFLDAVSGKLDKKFTIHFTTVAPGTSAV